MNRKAADVKMTLNQEMDFLIIGRNSFDEEAPVPDKVRAVSSAPKVASVVGNCIVAQSTGTTEITLRTGRRGRPRRIGTVTVVEPAPVEIKFEEEG